MGNAVWSCNDCNFPNLNNRLDCQKCGGEKPIVNRVNFFTGMGSKNFQIISRNRTQKSLAVEKSAIVRTNINEYARAHTPILDKKMKEFCDTEFPASNQSLYIDGLKIKRKNLLHSNGFKHVRKWLRPHEIKVASEEKYLPISLFSDPSPKDVIQGELGSCWFLSALALLVEKPFLLLNCMVTQYYNPKGFYQVRLCRRGEWVVVNIDDFLPCDKNEQLVFSLGRRRQLWVPLMEKALAKLYGSYEAIARGACADGLQSLTGEPSEVLYLQLGVGKPYVPNEISFEKEFWKKILHSRKLGYLMTCLCFNEKIKLEVFNSVGLLHTHIYSILDVREFENFGKPIRLLKLRNPWGHKEWKGDWSNGWALWPNHIKSQVSVYHNNDGCFWISFDDVLKYFYDITICKVRANWTESRHSSFFYDYSNQAEVYMISVTQPGVYELEIELFATGRKHSGFDRNSDPEIDLCLIISKVDTSKGSMDLTCIAFEHSVEYYINLAAQLTAGTYMVFATSIKAISSHMRDVNKEQYAEPNFFSYNIVFHCQTSFSLNRTIVPSEIISDVFYGVAKISNRVKYELNGNVRTTIISRSCTHAIMVENLSPNYCVQVKLNMSNSKNLESTRFTNVTEDFLYPLKRQLIVFLTPMNYRKGFVIGYKLDTLIYPFMTTGNNPPVIDSYSGLHAIRNVK